MKYYISGPMSGLPNNNREAFEYAAKTLRTFGWDVVSPTESDGDIPVGSKWRDYLKKDLKVLSEVDGMIMLEGWEGSRGARLEQHIAFQLGMPIYRFNGANAVLMMRRSDRD